MEVINQKEYLKKYLSGNKDKKKKKRIKKDATSDRVNIIDDVIDISKISVNNTDDLFEANEDAPQIVGVFDERPLHMRIDDYRKSELWRPLGATSTTDETETTFKPLFQKEKEFLLKLIKKEPEGAFKQVPLRKLYEIEGEKKQKGNGAEVKRWNIKDRTSKKDRSNDGENEYDSSEIFKGTDDSSLKPSRRNSNSSADRYENDSSPPRKSRRTSDSSPPRKPVTNADTSPPRKSRRISVSSPPRKNTKSISNSPHLKSNRNNYNSPPRRSTHSKDNSTKTQYNSPRRGNSSNRERNSPQRKLLPGDKKGKYLIPAKRMTKTLDGKTAGLQNAQELVKENETFRKREEDLFKNMSSDVSGANASTIIRDKRTGKIRDFEKEKEDRLKKEKIEEANKEKYSRWGKGLKQVEEYENKLQEDLLEMNKPLARYADDEDLERYLREQEREGDPMLDYIRKKRKKVDIEMGKPTKPQFDGEFMPNRFGIRPGHRWDGVDRSNGYEKKWIDVQNAKQAIQEEIYKWSTEDM
ncbi:hypothetical protein FQA39_LY11491 [Lamprigera yunnana]|nr:hypothetical protein FQA39_LY11491 [Lamprigera yunnana]